MPKQLLPEEEALLEALEAEMRKPTPRPMRTLGQQVFENDRVRCLEIAKQRRVVTHAKPTFSSLG